MDKRRKTRFKILKFLKEAQPCYVSEIPANSRTYLMLKGAGSQSMLAGQEDMETLAKAGLLIINEMICHITSAGVSMIKRAQNADANDPEGFANQHRDLTARQILLSGIEQTVTTNIDESPLYRLRHRKDGLGRPWIDEAAFQAGEKLRRDFTVGGLMQRVTASWDTSVGRRGGNGGAGTQVDLMDGAIDARERFSSAMDTVGPDLAGVLIDFCCFLKGLESIERERKWPPRSAKLMLRTGLDILVRFYGLETKGPLHTKMRSWGDAGYRPQVSG